MKFQPKLFLILLVFSSKICFGQDFYTDLLADKPELISEFVLEETIKTIQLHPTGKPLAYPVIFLNGQETLALSFDELGNLRNDFNLTLIHCDADWQPSGLSYDQYIDGFSEIPITNVVHSFNTNIDYMHYAIDFPNNDLKITMPGNYVLFVYNDFDKNKPVFTKRFIVVEPVVKIEAEVKRSSLPTEMDEFQQVNAEVFFEGLTVNNAIEDFKLVVYQNFNHNSYAIIKQPEFIGNSTLTYSHLEALRFPGIKEFRYFDCKSTRFKAERIKNINVNTNNIEFELITDTPRERFPYRYDEDINGKFSIRKQEAFESNNEADYVKVKFTWDYPGRFETENFYIAGAFNGFQAVNPMVLNAETGKYELVLQLKQGYYNYLVGFGKLNQALDFSFTEGSSYETENDYLVFSYFRKSGQRFFVPVGYRIVNSLNKY